MSRCGVISTHCVCCTKSLPDGSIKKCKPDCNVCEGIQHCKACDYAWHTCNDQVRYILNTDSDGHYRCMRVVKAEVAVAKPTCGDLVKECPACSSKILLRAECRDGCKNCRGVYTCQGCMQDFHICQNGVERYFCINVSGHYRCWKDTKVVETKVAVVETSKPKADVKTEVKAEVKSVCGDVPRQCPACLSKNFIRAECKTNCMECSGVYFCQGCGHSYHICQNGLGRYSWLKGQHFRCPKDTKDIEVGTAKVETSKPSSDTKVTEVKIVYAEAPKPKPETEISKPKPEAETSKPKPEAETAKPETPLERYRKFAAEETELLLSLTPGDACVRCGEVNWEPAGSDKVAARKCKFCDLVWHVCLNKEGIIVVEKSYIECEFCSPKPAVAENTSFVDQLSNTIERLRILPEALRLGDACPRCWNNDYTTVHSEDGVDLRECAICKQTWHVCPIIEGMIIYPVADGQKLTCRICKKTTEDAKKKADEELKKKADEKIGTVQFVQNNERYQAACPRCQKCDQVHACLCENDCDHYNCDRCEVTWHECPNDEGIFIMSNEAGHLYCCNCKSEKWMSRLRLNLAREEKARRESYNLAMKKVAADAKKKPANKANRP